MRAINSIALFIIMIAVFASRVRCDDAFDTLQLRAEIREIVNCFMAPPSFSGIPLNQEAGNSSRICPSVEDSYLGEGGRASPKYTCFQSLLKIALRSELIALSSHPNTAVKCYGLWALIIDTQTNLLELAIEHIGDTGAVQWGQGCIWSHETVADFVVGRIVYPSYRLNGRKLNQKDLQTLDSILICTPNVLIAQLEALDRADPHEYLYEHIRRLAIVTKTPSAKRALARYHKTEDSSLILEK